MPSLSRVVVGLSLLTGIAGLSAAAILVSRPYLAVEAHQMLAGAPADDLYRVASRARLAQLDAQLPPGRIVILGDSLVEQLFIGAVSPDAVNFGIGFDTIDGVAGRTRMYQSVVHARAIVIAIGTNDIPFESPEQIGEGMARLLAALPTTVPLFSEAILPVDDRLRPERPMAKIGTANAAIRAACGRVASCRFINPSALLADSDGRLDARYHVGDGLHLNAEGDAVWANFLKQSLATAVEPAGSLPN